MRDVVYPSLPASDLCKLMFGGSLERERGGGHLRAFCSFSFRPQMESTGGCWADLRRLAPPKERSFCPCDGTSRFCAPKCYTFTVGSN